MITTLTFALALSGQPILVLKGLDPIDLLSYTEVPGLEKFSTVVGRHEYRFASKEHRDQFRANPYRFAVQNGGACGKMGALSGHGSPDRWSVVEGRIFLFASEGCRTSFMAQRDAYFAPRMDVPKATAREQLQAVEIYTKMIEGHGGAKATGAVKAVEWTYEIPYQEGGKPKLWYTKAAFMGPEKFANWEQWDAGMSFFVKDGRRSGEGKAGSVFSIHPGELREMTAAVARNPIAIVLGGGGKPVKPLENGVGFVMARGDIVTTVTLDPKSHRIASIEFRDVYAGPIRAVRQEFSDYEVISGVAFPKTKRTAVDGGAWGKPTSLKSIVVNGPEPVVFAEALR